VRRQKYASRRIDGACRRVQRERIGRERNSCRCELEGSAVFCLLLILFIALQTPLLIGFLSDLLNLRLRWSRLIKPCRPDLSAITRIPINGTYHSPVFLHVFTSLPLITPTISPINLDFDPSGSAAYSLTKANSP
jgi:hypothetical protein